MSASTSGYPWTPRGTHGHTGVGGKPSWQLECGSRAWHGPARRFGHGEAGDRHWRDFDSVKDSRFSLPSPDSNIAIRILAGCTTGAMAVTCAQPTDVVKVRFQAMIRLGTGGERKYRGTMDAYRTIAREEGIRGLWKGKHLSLRQSFPSLRAETGNPARRNSQSMVQCPKNAQITIPHTPATGPQILFTSPVLTCVGHPERDRREHRASTPQGFTTEELRRPGCSLYHRQGPRRQARGGRG